MWVIMSGCFLGFEYWCATASIPQMVRKRSHAVEFQEEDLDRSPSPPLVIHRHTDVEVNTLNPGCQPRRTHTSYVSLPKSPEKNRGTTALCPRAITCHQMNSHTMISSMTPCSCFLTVNQTQTVMTWSSKQWIPVGTNLPSLVQSVTLFFMFVSSHQLVNF